MRAIALESILQNLFGGFHLVELWLIFVGRFSWVDSRALARI
ncbi:MULTISPECIES: hypothetical protein [unclassified Helicobacter]|nr:MULTISPECIES: hypothetical protein [unclassified Helicobacter]